MDALQTSGNVVAVVAIISLTLVLCLIICKMKSFEPKDIYFVGRCFGFFEVLLGGRDKNETKSSSPLAKGSRMTTLNAETPAIPEAKADT